MVYTREGLENLPTPTKDGYTFKGWKKDLAYETEMDDTMWKKNEEGWFYNYNDSVSRIVLGPSSKLLYIQFNVTNITSIPKGTTGDISLTAEWEAQ